MIERLVHALQALAAPTEARMAPSPQFGIERDGEELALDYADALRLVTDCQQIYLTPEQQSALERVDDALERIAAARRTAPAIQESAEWNTVRRLAAAALVALGQPLPLDY